MKFWAGLRPCSKGKFHREFAGTPPGGRGTAPTGDFGLEIAEMPKNKKLIFGQGSAPAVRGIFRADFLALPPGAREPPRLVMAAVVDPRFGRFLGRRRLPACFQQCARGRSPRRRETSLNKRPRRAQPCLAKRHAQG